MRSRPSTSNTEVEVCASCHSRRQQFSSDVEDLKRSFFEAFRPSLLENGLYHSDGQQRDEVYKYGSFLQSKMYAAGVTCSDCHDPHSGRLRGDGNAVCSQCHAPEKFDTATHHHHKAGSNGARCANCHMPATTYMGVDARHDHSFRSRGQTSRSCLAPPMPARLAIVTSQRLGRAMRSKAGFRRPNTGPKILQKPLIWATTMLRERNRLW